MAKEANEALEIVRDLAFIEETGVYPYPGLSIFIEIEPGVTRCGVCGADYPDHKPHCVYERAKRLLESKAICPMG